MTISLVNTLDDGSCSFPLGTVCRVLTDLSRWFAAPNVACEVAMIDAHIECRSTADMHGIFQVTIRDRIYATPFGSAASPSAHGQKYVAIVRADESGVRITTLRSE